MFFYRTHILILLLTLTTPNLFAEVPFTDWDRVEKQVRDGTISRVDAQQCVKQLLPELNKYCAENGLEVTVITSTQSVSPRWTFPVEGYGIKNIGEPGYTGYAPKGYNFYDGNKHGGHPAVDIFIRDKNQDTIDDKTGHQVNVLAVSTSIVLAVSTGWQPSSGIRGGNYVYTFLPGEQLIVYYAHLDKVEVKPGDVIFPGKLIGTMGRTGKNAYPSRSPTHLHIMCLSYDKNAGLSSVNVYNKLCRPGHKR
ncbi:MAG: M23 family metallopeptidase [Elusimicrobiota bacterium]